MVEYILGTPIFQAKMEEYDKENLIQAVSNLVQDSSFNSSSNNPSFFGDIYSDIKQPHELDCFSDVNKFIAKQTRKYINKLGSENIPDVYVQKSWGVRLQKEGGVSPHKHVNAHLSCVFYISVNKDEGAELTFESEYDLFQNLPIDCESYVHKLKPEDGTLVIFPSTLLHYVSESSSEKDRYCVSYDLMLTSKEKLENKTLDPSQWRKLT